LHEIRMTPILHYILSQAAQKRQKLKILITVSSIGNKDNRV
jgi:hypothetical protein